MRRAVPFLVVLFSLTIAAAQTPAPLTIIRAGALLDPATGNLLHDQEIVIRGNRIEAVRPAAAAPAGATVIDLSHATVLPGLIESHTHIFLQGEDPAKGGYDDQLLKWPLSFRAARAAVSARRALEQGFTTIRDMETEGAGYGDVGIKEAINGGYIPGPRMFVVTRAISTTGGYPLEGYAPEIEQSLPKGVQIIDGPVEARKAAREQLDNGADWIKVYMTHRSWVDKDGKLFSQPTLTVEELEAITSEAHAWGRKVACHAYGGEGLRRALVGGCDSIEHGLDLSDQDIAFMKAHGIWYCPTLSVYYDHDAPPDTPEGKRDLLRIQDHEVSFKKALQAGLKIVFGTDVGGFDWSEPIAQEFGRMTAFGMSPLHALQSATVLPAEMLDMQGKIGVIAPGAYADIIAVQGDPLQDVNLLEHVRFVMKDGKVFKNELHP
jgi:imidazolonepropionase-like amidohydrolase